MDGNCFCKAGFAGTNCSEMDRKLYKFLPNCSGHGNICSFYLIIKANYFNCTFYLVSHEHTEMNATNTMTHHDHHFRCL